jgi:hypothetical protein
VAENPHAYRGAGPDCRSLEAAWQIPRVQEAAVTGLILAALIGVLVAFGWTRLRSKMKLSVSAKDWLVPTVLVVGLVLVLWASHAGR